ncbi:MAG TPA: hypothetical protein VL856_15900, partial [Acidimicrobiia bacterium]|nr:hypothetical protein [Acidimicrobiia bacterium]
MHGRARLILLTAAVALAVVGCTAASAGGRGLPTPRPEAVRASGTISVFPVPGTPAASPSTTISFRGVAPNRIGPINVFGARTGEHKGHLVAHSDGRGASFVPDDPFDAGEIVTVHTDLSIRGAQHGTFTYTISRPADRAPTNVTPPSET